MPTDVTAPTLESLDIGTPVLTIGGEYQVVVTARFTDDISGVGTEIASIRFTSASGQTVFADFDILNPLSGDRNDGVFQAIVTLGAFAETGTWSADLVWLDDVAGNRVQFEPDNSPLVADASFDIGGLPTNDPPVLTGDLSATLLEGQSVVIAAADLGFTDPDDPPSNVTFTTSSHVNGVVQVNGVTQSSFTGTQLQAGLVTFQHDGSETSSASFNVGVEDGNEDSSAPSSSLFSLTVTPVNDGGPLGQADAFAMLETGSVSGNVFASNGSGADSDPDGDSFTVTLVNGATLASGVAFSLASGALLTMESNGSFRRFTRSPASFMSSHSTATRSSRATSTATAERTSRFNSPGLSQSERATSFCRPSRSQRFRRLTEVQHFGRANPFIAL